MTMTLVETITVGSGGTTSIEFTNIPQTGTDLLIVASLRQDSANPNTIGVSLNSSVSGSARRMRGDGASVGSSTESNLYVTQAPGTAYTGNTFSSMSIYISNYTSSSNKSISWETVIENNATASRQDVIAANSTTTSSITAVALVNPNSNIVQYSSASLYIITKA